MYLVFYAWHASLASLAPPSITTSYSITPLFFISGHIIEQLMYNQYAQTTYFSSFFYMLSIQSQTPSLKSLFATCHPVSLSRPAIINGSANPSVGLSVGSFSTSLLIPPLVLNIESVHFFETGWWILGDLSCCIPTFSYLKTG